MLYGPSANYLMTYEIAMYYEDWTCSVYEYKYLFLLANKNDIFIYID